MRVINNKHLLRVAPRKLLLLVLSTCTLVACSSLEKIVTLKSFSAADEEPKVSFIDAKAGQEQLPLQASKIKVVNAEKVISSYKRLLNRGNPAVRAEALHQLANITMQLSESQQAESEEASGNQAEQNAQASIQQAISYYQTLLAEFPDYQAKADVNYQLARAYALNAEPEAALKTLDQIAQADTSFNAYVESQFRRGESYFVRKQYAVAANAYQQVLTNGKDTEFYDKALYKMGWSLFKQSQYNQAQVYFFELYEKLRQTQSADTSLTESRTNLNADLLADTKRVISLSFYNLDGVESIIKHFSQQAEKDYQHDIYAALGELYLEQERYQDAASTYKGFIAKHPLSLHSPQFHSEIINIYKRGGFPSLILPEKQSFVENYGRFSQFWSVHNAQVKEDLKPLLKRHLDDISRFYHAAAQKSKQPKDYLVAAKWYREILATFVPVNTLDSQATESQTSENQASESQTNESQTSKSQNSIAKNKNNLTDEQNAIDSQYRFLLAETLDAGLKPLLAAQEYEVVAYKNKASEYSRDAGYRALVAYGKVQYANNVSSLERLLPSIISGLKFSQSFSGDPQAPTILARVSEQQLEINDVAAAIKSSQQLLQLPSKNALQYHQRARIIIANGLFDLKQYQQAEQAIAQLLLTGGLSKAQRLEFRKRRVEALYKLAEQARDSDKPKEAIALFLKVKQLEPGLAIATNAHYDAASLLILTEQWQQASQLLLAFRADYPKHALTKSIAEKLVVVYEKLNDWSGAANEYKQLAANQTDPNLAREGYWQVAQLYLKAKNEAQAIDAFKFYERNFPSPYLLAQESRNHLVELYQKQQQAGKANFWKNKLVDFYQKNTQQNNTRMNFLVAKYSFELAEPLFNQYKAIKLKLPLAKSLKAKRAAMKKSLQAYNKIAAYGAAEYTTASTHKVAIIYQILADDLMTSQRPKGLDEDELEEYGYLLEDQAIPFEDKAIEYFEVNAQRTQQQLYDDSIKASIESLKKLKPAQYDKTERMLELDDVAF